MKGGPMNKNATVAILSLPLDLTVFRLGFVIFPFLKNRIVPRRMWRGYCELQHELEQESFDNTIHLLDRLFMNSRIIEVEIGSREFTIYVSQNHNPENVTQYVIKAISEAYLDGAEVEIIRGKRIFIKGLSFDIPLEQEIEIGEP